MREWQKIRKVISQRLIENNGVLVQAMKNHNRIYGRSKSVWGRAKLAAELYWKYAILSKSPVEVRLNRIKKMRFPESTTPEKFDSQNIIEQGEKCGIIVLDFWNVLFYTGAQKGELLALFETITQYPGIVEYMEDSHEVSEKLKSDWEDLITDFALKNEFIYKLCEEAEKRRIKISVYNNSEEYENDVIKKILQRHNLRFEIHHENKMNSGDIVYITAQNNHAGSVYYKSVNIYGEAYRPFYQTNIITELYTQIVNLKFHAGDNQISFFYEYGFGYGGILACGFCQFLNDLAKKEDIDKFIFVARDGDILRKVYEKYFKTRETAYLVFSRFASYELIFEDFPEEYIDKNIKARIFRKNKDNSIKKILEECHLEVLKQILEDEGVCLSEQLTLDNYKLIKSLLLKSKKEIQSCFQESCDAAKKYFLSEADGYRKICIVDVGWHGKSTVYLKHLMERKYAWNGTVIGAQIGASDDRVTQQYIRNGLINSYAFEDAYWRKTGTTNGDIMEEDEIICIEALFSSEAKTLLRYKLSEGDSVDFIYGKENENQEKIREIHKGTLDFCEQFIPFLEKYQLHVTARDAYTPLDSLLQNKGCMKKIIHEYKEESNAIHGF
ncbi:MAG: hypothetical protein SOY47_00190 [Lachnospiraceae bacterium]|nr:hypothetical protein [Lachnospiraceae bacterium]